MTEYYTLKQAMKKMQISRYKIMQLIVNGQLEYYRIGSNRGTYRITDEQIDRCMRGVSQGGHEQR